MDVVLRAPNARDEANLFPTAPDAIPDNAACAEDGKLGAEIEQAGTPVMVRDWLPFPGAERSVNPNMV